MYVKIQSLNGKDLLVNAEDICLIQKTKYGCSFILKHDSYIYDCLCSFEEFVETVTKDKEIINLIEQGDLRK